ncbi:putative short-chain dehydrogenase/reductase [Microtetraspora sp. NBRC 13810]|uniref:SDR family NAD(P)-dependent oxidoreductase n=1 Tax=Microtetraspora sp. NBRC 13810 TaxID=3030990 RepID=UPI0024A32A39|nr:SDR family NAD(P)-dependent oxidoreductase [Microtetraspora sp. NBRC 13810]GLW12595.1 putative short-chain dehydrogenase/reductase [Microtetraspora sp. NBRC 13810]
MGSLDGRIVLITGAGRGIGREEALFFAAEGAKVVVNDPGVGPDGSGGDPAVTAAVVAEITALGGEAVASADSVTDPDGARRMVDLAVETFGDLHAVVNNAGTLRNRALVGMTDDDFDDILAVKLKGTFTVTRWAARHWRARHEAGARESRAVINTSSGSGLANPLPTQTSYAAANAGVAAMTVVAALELGRYGVRVNCIAPSTIRTRLTAGVPGMPAVPADGGFDPAHPAACAPVAAYLASDGCPLTGQVISVRGTAVTVNRRWSPVARIAKEGAPWEVAELAGELERLPLEDPFEILAASFGAALGPDAGAAIQKMIEDALDGAA